MVSDSSLFLSWPTRLTFYFLSPVQLRSNRAALVGMRHPARVNPPQLYRQMSTVPVFWTKAMQGVAIKGEMKESYRIREKLSHEQICLWLKESEHLLFTYHSHSKGLAFSSYCLTPKIQVAEIIVHLQSLGPVFSICLQERGKEKIAELLPKKKTTLFYNSDRLIVWNDSEVQESSSN